MTELPLPGPLKQDCVCGCGVFGNPRRKAWQDGLGPHSKACECRRCQGGRTKARARRQEHRVAKDTHGERSPLSGQLSGADTVGGLVDTEVTANKTVVRGFLRWFTSKTVTTKCARLFARGLRPTALVLVWGGKPRAAIMEYESFRALLGELADE